MPSQVNAGAIPGMGALLGMASAVVWLPSLVWTGILFSLAVAAAHLVGSGMWSQAPDNWMRGFILGWALLLGYLVFAAAFVLLLGLSRLVLGVRNRPTPIPLQSARMLVWYHILFGTYAAHILIGPLLQATGLYRFFARLMGAHVGVGTLINSTRLYDHDLITLGDRVLIGGDAYLVCHVAERGHLLRAPITIGDGSSIGLQTVVLPGATLGRNCHVGAQSLVPKNAVLDDDSVYAGVPVHKIRDLRTEG